MEGVTKKLNLLINFSSQNTFMFRVKLSDITIGWKELLQSSICHY